MHAAAHNGTTANQAYSSPRAQPKVKAKAKAKSAAEKQELLRPRVDKCQWCGLKREGWCDRLLSFYCTHCWSEYDQQQGQEGEEYAGKIWHDAILEAENAAEETNEDGGQVIEFMKNALHEIDNPDKDGAGISSDEDYDEDDEVAPLAEAPNQSARAQHMAAPEIQQAHVIVMVDTSGSMRTIDVKPDRGAEWVSRMSAVASTLSTFFEKQAQAACPHRFSLISFSHESHVHFIRRAAAQAAVQVRHAVESMTARCGTHFAVGLAAVKEMLGMLGPNPETPHLLLFSDGRPADGMLTLSMVQDMTQTFETLRIHAIGFGDGLDFDVLQQLTSIGRGTFAPSGRSIAALHQAFASVTSTITQSQTVTSRSSKSSSFSFQGVHGQASREDAHRSSRESMKKRAVTFEPANQFWWGADRSVDFQSRRRALSFDGKTFHEYLNYPPSPSYPKSVRLQPFTEGGMRLVYCFKDSSIPLHAEQRNHVWAMQSAGTDARMVAKLSKYEDDWHNSLEVVSAYARSSAVAKFYSRVFTFAAADRLGLLGRRMAKIIFVECYIYEAEDGSGTPAKYMVGERYLPGAFLKYNSNHGYVNTEAPDTEVAQAFSHFTFEASGGKHMVLDLQGVYTDKAYRLRPHLIMTDPQVVSLERAFGPGDLGEAGMLAFFKSHRCGKTCNKLKLDPQTLRRLRRVARTTPTPAESTPESSAGSASVSAAQVVSGESGSIMGLRVPEAASEAEAPAPPKPVLAPSLGRAIQEVAESRVPALATAGLPTRQPPAFGAKADGPLSALMARSPAMESGRPTFEAWLQSQKPSAPQPLQPSTTVPALPGRPPPADEALAAPKVDGCVQRSREDSGASQRSSSARRSEGERSPGSTTAEWPPSPQQDLKKTIVYGPDGQKMFLTGAARGDVMKAITAQWSIPEDEQLLFQEASSQVGTEFFRVERKMDPRKLRFTQDSISPAFRDGRPIFQLMNDLNSQAVDPLRELEPLDVVWHEGYWRSLSNRRLWTLKHCTAAMTDQPLYVRVRVRQKDAEFRAKWNSTNDGVSVLVVNRTRSPSPARVR